MVSIMRTILIIGRTWRVVALVGSFCLICSIPRYGFCLASDGSDSNKFAEKILSSVAIEEEASLIESFDALKESIQASADPLEEGRKFLHAFINEINSTYGLNLTIQDACVLVKQNLPTLGLDPEAQKIILATIELFEVSPNELSSSSEEEPNAFQHMINNLPSHSLSIYWPWEWNWFGLNKKDHKHRTPYPPVLYTAPLSQITSPSMEKELPANCYVGGCELLAGSLIFILPLPGAQWLGGLMIGDGVRRVVDGVVQLGDERRTDPNYKPPSGFGVDF